MTDSSAPIPALQSRSKTSRNEGWRLEDALIWMLLKSIGVGLLLIVGVCCVLFGLVWIGLHYWPVFVVFFVLAWAAYLGSMFLSFTEP